MNRHGIDPDDFLEKVHDIDYSWLKPDPVLGAAIGQLPGRKFIFTNGNRGHAERTARQLGILDHFDDIFDIVAAGLTPKPAPQTYDLFLASTGSPGRNAVMFEDLARNLAVPKALGMITVLIVPRNFEPTFSEIWERDAANEDDVDFVTDDLAGFLVSLIADRRPLEALHLGRSADRRRRACAARPAAGARPFRRAGRVPGVRPEAGLGLPVRRRDAGAHYRHEAVLARTTRRSPATISCSSLRWRSRSPCSPSSWKRSPKPR